MSGITKRKPNTVKSESFSRFFVGMRKILFAWALGVFILNIHPANAQENVAWYNLLWQPNVNYQQVVSAFERDLAGYSDQEREAHLKHFNRWKQETQAYVKADGYLMSGAERLSAYQSSNAMKKAPEGNWNEIGPFTAKNVYRGVGRINCLAFHPTDSNTMYAGAPYGGVWKTTDYGDTWQNLTDHLPSFGVSAITLHPKNPDIVYVGTGDGETRRNPGTGVWRSKDGGITWEPINEDMESLIVNEIAVFDTEPTTLVAASSTGVFKSTDDGATWDRKQGGAFVEMRVKPGNDKVMYAATINRFFKSADGGDTWRVSQTPVLPEDRVALDVSPAAPNNVYMIAHNVVMKSTDDGETFSVLYKEEGLRDLGSQSWYNTAGAVSPTDPDVIYQGHVPFYVARGSTEDWVKLEYIHSDVHFINHSPLTGRLWAAGDGGVMSLKDDGYTWKDHTNMSISQIYKMSQNPMENDHLLNGYQDCGSKYYTGNRWISRVGADGMDCDFNPQNPEIYFTTIQYGDLRRHLDGPDGRAGNFPDPEEKGPWVSPVRIDYDQPDIVYTAQNSFWRYKGANETQTSKDNWEKVANGLPASGPFVLIEQHKANPDIFFTARGRNVYKTSNLRAGTPLWKSLNTLNSESSILGVVTPQDDSNTLYVSATGQVHVSFDGGNSFTNLSTGLPDLPIYNLAYDQVTGNLYAGCGVGVYCLPKAQSEWLAFSSGLSLSAPVYEIEIFYDTENHDNSMIKAATYGRGMWESPLYGSHPDPKLPFYPFIQAENEILETETFVLDVVFRRGIAHQDIVSLEEEDITLENAKLIEIKGQGNSWTITLEGLENGLIRVSIPSGKVVSKDDPNRTNEASEILNLKYVKTGPTFGYEGPGGVGSYEQIALWMDSDDLLKTYKEGDEVRDWSDHLNSEKVASQVDTFEGPKLYNGDLFNGHPAVDFDAELLNKLVADSIVTTANISAITVAASDTAFFNDNAWMGSSRMDNGFIIHNNKEHNHARMYIYDSTNQNLRSATTTIKDITKPHIYGLSYRNEVYLWNFTDDQEFFVPVLNPRPRFESQAIDIRLGYDKDQRYGEGKMAEFILLNEEMKISHKNIIYNYLSAKHGIDIGTIDLYSFEADFPYHVAGIGRESAIDLHSDARGTGILRVKDPTDLNDGEYLLWGANDGSLEDWDPYTMDGFEMADIQWKFQERGEVGSVTLLLPSSDLDESYIYYLSSGDQISRLPLTDEGYSVAIDVSQKGVLQLLRTKDNGTFGTPVIYPNPVSQGGTITIQYESSVDGEMVYELFDMAGRQMMDESHKVVAGNLIHKLTIGDLSNGRFILKIKTPDGEFLEPLMVLNR